MATEKKLEDVRPTKTRAPRTAKTVDDLEQEVTALCTRAANIANRLSTMAWEGGQEQLAKAYRTWSERLSTEGVAPRPAIGADPERARAGS